MKSIYIKVTVLLEKNGQHVIKPFGQDFNYGIGKKENKKVSSSKILQKNKQTNKTMSFIAFKVIAMRYTFKKQI